MSMPISPRLAVIGCGAIVDHHLVPALKRIGWLPSVLIDPSPRRIEVVARRMGNKGKGFVRGADWRDVKSDFDAALVAVPHAFHAPLGTALLEAGKHLFMEKPLATTRADCERMVAASEAAGAVLAVGLQRRYLKIAQWTKALLTSGTLGDIRHFDVREGFVFNWDTSTPAILDPKLSGGGVLMDTGPHTLDLVTWWLGEVDDLDYREDAQGGVEADCVLECRMASGATGRIELSRTRELRNAIRITGSKGFVEVHLYKNEILAGSDNALSFVHDGIAPATMEPQFFSELFDAELRNFRDAASGLASVLVSGREATRSVDVIERCYGARQLLKAPWAELAEPEGPATRPGVAMGSKVVVTGATGFIGGRLAERLLEQGAQVRCLVRNFGHATRIARLRPEIVAADLADASAIDQAIAGQDIVFHCAYDPRSRTQNLTGLQNIIAACVKHDVKRLVFVSTFSVYEPFPEGRLSEETRDGDRGWAYTRTKLEMEEMVLQAHREHGLQVSIVQPSCVYGPFAKSWTNAPAENLIYGTVVLPEGDGLCNAVYIDDLVDGLILAATHEAAVGERFIMSGPAPVRWSQFFSQIADALGVKGPKLWPAEQIAKSNSGLMRDVKLVAKNPKKIIQIMVRWYPVRQALQTGLDALPEPFKGLVMKHYFGTGGRRPGEVTLPDPQQLNLYAAQAHCDNDKARRLIGYAPRYDFQAGMKPTRIYLDWAYSDTKRAVAAMATPKPKAASVASQSRDARHAG